MVRSPMKWSYVNGIDYCAMHLGTAFSSDEEEGAVEEDLLAVLKVCTFCI